MAVTLKEVAERAGVSRSAVSRTFTEGASVSAKTRRKVEEAALALDYRPSLIARSLATKRTMLIGLVANNFQNPVFLEVFDLFTGALQQRGLRPLLLNQSHETDPKRSLSLLRQYNVDGVIVATSTLPPSFAQAVRKANIPVIHTFGKYDSPSNVHVVGIDNARCGAMAAETLVLRGYRSAAMLGGPKSATSTQDRVAGFTRKARELGLAVTDIRYADSYTYGAGHQAMGQLLVDHPVEVVFCGDDLICMGAMDAARGKGFSIPDQIGFLGFNDMAMASWDAYDLTTIRQPIRDIILSSVELVVAMAKDSSRSKEIRLFDCSIVERGSLRPLAAPAGTVGAEVAETA
ncbi:LacI family DNA-binding transcriptional regulator [Geminicoccus roseus]|uniref:LacI family DNA-binding transcriptional regulator n=1 Tax=Geminicoccus roseus TaxID=404900 RepID=UPI000410CD2D|nr:LacI family DNA-binding transcriptional regulator [Geminicoccus roseus]